MTQRAVANTIEKLEASLKTWHGDRAADKVLLAEALAIARDYQQLLDDFESNVNEARIEALRELAYGAGHEINNPLANIAARAQALLPEEHDPERRRRLATIVDQAFRARDMIGGLMVFARPPRANAVDTTIDDIVRTAIDAVSPNLAPRKIRFEYDPSPSPVPMHVDATQVSEGLRMLLVNAIEAVDDGGRVHVDARQDAMGQAVIMIEDDGPGMDSATAAKACDPFYSGREAGRGIGLGLPKARRLVEANGGTLTIESRPGHGTRCSITMNGTAAAS